MKSYTVPIIIPSYEPDERLLKLLDGLQDNKLEPIVIVDDGSSAEYQRYFIEANGIMRLY